MWALIDNYDSFTHILHHYLLQLHAEVRVWRNDELTVTDLERLAPERIIISPGPGRPSEAGITPEVVARFHRHTPILGVCLGHQALGVFYGARLAKAGYPVHGTPSPIQHAQEDVFRGLPANFPAMRYHSLVIRDWEHTELKPLAFTEDGILMAFRHKQFPSTGIQFHPESVLTAHGLQLLRNWAGLYPAGK